jgi:hypothetical protein
MLAAVALGANLLLADASPALTLDGTALGASVKDVVAAHKGATPAKSPAGQTWMWTRPGGGTVRLTADEDGNVAIVDFVASKTGSGAIDLPAARAFLLQSSHDKYSDVSSYVESDACTLGASATVTCHAYTLEDGSELLLSFANGPLREALWGDRALLKQLGLIQAGVSL